MSPLCIVSQVQFDERSQKVAVTALEGDCTGKQFNSKLYGNNLYCTNALLLLIKIMLCSKLHCQIFLKLTFFTYKIGRARTSTGPLLKRSYTSGCKRYAFILPPY